MKNFALSILTCILILFLTSYQVNTPNVYTEAVQKIPIPVYVVGNVDKDIMYIKCPNDLQKYIPSKIDGSLVVFLNKEKDIEVYLNSGSGKMLRYMEIKEKTVSNQGKLTLVRVTQKFPYSNGKKYNNQIKKEFIVVFGKDNSFLDVAQID